MLLAGHAVCFSENEELCPGRAVLGCVGWGAWRMQQQLADSEWSRQTNEVLMKILVLGIRKRH